MNNTFQVLMQEATRLTRAGQLAQATQVIQRAMAGDKATVAPSKPTDTVQRIAPDVLDGCVREVDVSAEPEVMDRAELAEQPLPTGLAPEERSAAASFVEGEFVHAMQRHRYKLFTPRHSVSAGLLPLVVMLHGCTQDPDDFAVGTGMNEAAQGASGFYVLYPSQPRNVNAQGCWNWFDRAHQQRGQGEPAWIAELTQHVTRTQGIDARRVYVAGLSAGGAMAAVVGSAYPDVFAAVGVHSGLPVGAASNLTQALTAMKRGASISSPNQPTSLPTIVFHGDQDRTVHAVNGQAVVAAATAHSDCAVLAETGQSEMGRKFTRTSHSNALRVQAEHWQLHGGTHAWSGGSAQGSYTDPRGVDATREMLRFFWLHQLGSR